MSYPTPTPSLRITLRVGAASAALAIAVLAKTDSAHGTHTLFLVDDPANNPNGMQSNEGTLFGGNKAWILIGTQFGVCSDWGFGNYFAMPVGIRDAIAAWENVLGGSQMSTNCGGTGYGLNLLRRTESSDEAAYGGSFPWPAWCDSGSAPYIACVDIDPYDQYDSSRKAWYPTSVNVWFNDEDYVLDTSAWKPISAHEIGHVFGLDEQYIEGPPIQCASVESVMNSAAAYYSGGQWHVSGNCDPPGTLQPVSLPNSTDSGRVQSFFYLMPIAGNVVSYGSAPGVLYLNFADLSYVEFSYYIKIYWCCGSGGQEYQIFAWNHTDSVGRRGDVRGIPWYRGSNPPGLYKMCGYTYNPGSGYMHYTCQSYKWVA